MVPPFFVPNETLTTVQLRFAVGDDVAGIREIYAPIVEHTAISFETVVPSDEELAQRVADTMPHYPWLVAAENGETSRSSQVLGYAYGHRFASRAAYAWSVETSIYVRDTARGQGIGNMLYGALLALLAAQGYQQAFAGIALPNAASVGLHEAIGFRHIGTYRDVGFKFQTWHDVGWWQRGLAEGTEAPRAPVSVDELAPMLVERTLK
jgi:phosphinothricin acetyltransferase